jgi:aryl-alcohol dehydrogenase-like predicted oxidoreductase
MKRILGSFGIEASAVGHGLLGDWRPVGFLANPAGWGEVDDAETIRAIHAALDMGVTLFDTAANYGCGHSERFLGQAVAGRRDKVVIATKFGY